MAFAEGKHEGNFDDPANAIMEAWGLERAPGSRVPEEVKQGLPAVARFLPGGGV